MSTLASIIEWAHGELCDWQGDAVRRLMTQGQLSEDDETEILAMLKERHNLVDAGKSAPKAKLLKQGDVSGSLKVPTTLTLKALRNLHNVNAIPDGSTLCFGHQGLTVVYGENGAGKSGYARVLKRACKARDTGEVLLPNAFDHAANSMASAVFKISVENAADQEVTWEDGHEGSDLLSNICVFDSRCARIIVDDNNEPIYLPYGADVFEALVGLLKRLRSRLENEQPKPKRPEYPTISAETEAGKFLLLLNSETPISDVDKHTAWTEDDNLRLLTLQKDILTIEANDWQKQTQRIRTLRDGLDGLLDRIVQIEYTLSEEKAIELQEALSKLLTAETALAIASLESLSGEPLPGAGGNAWQILYDAAKEYSTQAAYPGKDFPVLDDALCVLCMQPLLKEAQARMLRFKSFMENTAKKKVEIAEEHVQKIHKQLSAVEFPSPEACKLMIEGIRDRNNVLAGQIEDYLPTMKARLADMTAAITAREVRDFLPGKPLSIECIAKVSNALSQEGDAIEKAAVPQELGKKKGERRELESRKLLSQKRQDILQYLLQLKIAKEYEACIAETDSRPITSRGREIISAALTSRLAQALKEELNILGVGHLPLNLRVSGVKGETRHKMELQGCDLPKKANLTDILSEGEQHVVAIAGFLAELKVRDHMCPIVLDDPVCSLDHRYRDRIAARLAEEASRRQVIVFTHDIAFLLELERKAAELQTYFHSETVQRSGQTPGCCIGGLPWHAMPLKERLEYLTKDLDTFKSLYSTDQNTYNKRASDLYDLLRQAWEAAVEEVLLNKTILRHGATVQTLRLKSVTVTDDDYTAIYWAIDKCSNWVHDRSKALDVNRPSPNSIREDIQSLREFKKTVDYRSNELQHQRDKSLQAKKPEVG